jgi:hypothetical protein
MKRFVFFALSALVCISCGLKAKVSDSNSAPEQKWEAMQDYLAPGTTVSSERPMPDILSEQEVLLKAADYAYKIGALDSSYYAYERNPKLLSAKIAAPILVHDFTGYPGGDGASYLLGAVDDSGVNLMSVYVRPNIDASDDSFKLTSGISPENEPDSLSTHYMTKTEAVNLIHSQFPDKQVSEPMAINITLADDPYSSTVIFWYFTTNDNQRGASGGSEEYIIDSYIRGYKNSIGGVSNRSAISTGNGGSPHLDGARMAKLNTPLRLFEKLEAVRSAGRSLISITAEPMEPIKYTPVPLR